MVANSSSCSKQSLLPLRPAGGEEITLNDHDSLAHLIGDDTVRTVFETRFALPVLTTRGTPQDHAIPRVYIGLILPCAYRKKPNKRTETDQKVKRNDQAQTRV
jgi:hypothetical protein